MAKRGRTTKYDPRLNGRLMKYTKECIKKHELPTFEHFATIIGVGTRTLYDWESVHDEFSHAMDYLRDTQKHVLINNALIGKYNARFATFLLKASHKYRENEPIITNNENNMNISPELLADAIKIMRSRAEAGDE